MQLKYPIIPLKNIVVFPGIIIPIFIGREKSIKALEFAQAEQSKVVFCLQKTNSDDPKTNEIHEIGVLAEIVSTTKVDPNTYKILVNGEKRVSVLYERDEEQQPYLEGYVKVLEDVQDFASQAEITDFIQRVYKQLENYLSLNKNLPSDIIKEIVQKNDVLSFIYALSHFLMFSVNDKQNILSIAGLKERLTVVFDLLIKEIDILKVEDKLHSTIKENIGKTQKEYYLKEKIKAIQEELGESSDYDELVEYQKRIEAAEMPAEIKEKAQRELRKLSKISNISSEAGIVKTYLEWLIEIPWQQTHQKDFAISEVATLLDAKHYGLDKVKERIKEFLAVYQLTQDIQGSILCLVGPSGVGKTSIVKSISEVMGRKFIKISCGGMNDEAELRGHRRTYVGAMPGRIIQAIRNAQSKNPVVLLDEIDKMTRNFQSNPTAVLLEVLDKEQNKNFYDYYLEVSFDLSDCLFIATANNIYDIPTPLLDRMELIYLSGYSLNEKLVIGRDYLWPKVLKQHGLTGDQLNISEEALEYIITYYTKEAGLRELERCLSAITRKIVIKVLQERNNYEIKPEHLQELLGHPKYKYSLIPNEAEIGVALGLAYTEHGGSVMPIEVSVFPGKGNLKLTGKMGDVMQESSQTAMSYIRLISKDLGLKKDFYENVDLHIHIPENAITKDGPSAGAAIAMALASACTKTAISNQVAMTGEISLHGKILPVGGLKEKLLAAERQNLKKVYVPKDNLDEVEEVRKYFRTPIAVIGISHIDELLRQELKGYEGAKKLQTWL
ncbi:MAG: endopeptidase La [Candidatus Margulisbacteria bacterium]|nr:endopeptidase La [Candidatus Margulisiibacteriota bacterium]